MNLTDEELNIIQELAKKFEIGSVYIFGSALEDNTTRNDIDIAVADVPAGMFFKFYGALLRRLGHQVDIVDLSIKNSVTKIITREAVKIYG